MKHLAFVGMKSKRFFTCFLFFLLTSFFIGHLDEFLEDRYIYDMLVARAHSKRFHCIVVASNIIIMCGDYLKIVVALKHIQGENDTPHYYTTCL